MAVRQRRTPVPRERSKQETRQALIEAAMAAFAEEGLEAPSLDAICERAGYTRGAFYVHFRDRDDLVAAVMERVTTLLLDALIATGESALDLERTIRTFADAVASGMYPPTGAAASYQVLQACARSERIRERYVATLLEARNRVSALARTGQAAGTVRSDVEADEIANLLIALVLASQTLGEVGFPFDVRRSTDAVLRLLLPYTRD
jgi:AcrR family transcriptional regulator